SSGNNLLEWRLASMNRPQSKCPPNRKGTPSANVRSTVHSKNGAPRTDFTVYYHRGKDRFFFERSPGNWQDHSIVRARKILTDMGFAADKLIGKAECEGYIDFAGPIGGRKAGRYLENGKYMLVTENPIIIPAIEGDWSTIKHVLTNLISSE